MSTRVGQKHCVAMTQEYPAWSQHPRAIVSLSVEQNYRVPVPIPGTHIPCAQRRTIFCLYLLLGKDGTLLVGDDRGSLLIPRAQRKPRWMQGALHRDNSNAGANDKPCRDTRTTNDGDRACSVHESSYALLRFRVPSHGLRALIHGAYRADAIIF
jgi:hypothetical protein